MDTNVPASEKRNDENGNKSAYGNAKRNRSNEKAIYDSVNFYSISIDQIQVLITKRSDVGDTIAAIKTGHVEQAEDKNQSSDVLRPYKLRLLLTIII